MDGMKAFKWIIGWKDKPKQPQQPQGEYMQRIDNPPRPAPRAIIFSDRPATINRVKYPLPPVQDSPPIKKLPSHLLPKKKTREGWY